jgi:hypothetical protein
MFYRLKNLLVLIIVIFKVKCSNLIFNEIIECFICVFTCILASSRITQSGSWKTDPSFQMWFCHIQLAAAPLVIWSSLSKSEPVVPQIDSMSWYSNRVGYVRRLYCLIFLYFENFAWMNYVVGIRDENNIFVISM